MPVIVIGSTLPTSLLEGLEGVALLHHEPPRGFWMWATGAGDVAAAAARRGDHAIGSISPTPRSSWRDVCRCRISSGDGPSPSRWLSKLLRCRSLHPCRPLGQAAALPSWRQPARRWQGLGRGRIRMPRRAASLLTSRMRFGHESYRRGFKKRVDQKCHRSRGTFEAAMNILSRLARSSSGAALTEYSIVIGIIITLVVVGVALFGIWAFGM